MHPDIGKAMENLSIVLDWYNTTSKGSGSGLDENGFPLDYSSYEDYGGESFFATYFSLGKSSLFLIFKSTI